MSESEHVYLLFSGVRHVFTCSTLNNIVKVCQSRNWDMSNDRRDPKIIDTFEIINQRMS